MKTKYIYHAIWIIILFTITSCQKEKIDKTTTFKNSNDEKFIKFNSSIDYNATLKKVLSFSDVERKKWEETLGFKSFATICNEFYFSINPEEFSNIESLKNYVNINSEYLQLKQDETGDFTLEASLINDPIRYLLNRDRLFQIGDTVYKVLENSIIHSNIIYINKLKAINEGNFLNYIADENIFIENQSLNEQGNLKDVTYNCGVWTEDRVTNGSERTYLRIGIYSQNIGNGTEQGADFMVRPYKKILGIWYWCTRTISCDIAVAVDYYVYTSPYSGSWLRQYATYSESGTSTSSISGILSSYWISIGFYGTPQSHFGGYHCWADTPSTDPFVSFECNPWIP